MVKCPFNHLGTGTYFLYVQEMRRVSGMHLKGMKRWGGARTMAIAACVALLPVSAVLAQVRAVPVSPVHPSANQKWRVGKAKTKACIDTDRIAGAVIMDQRTLDVVLRGGERFRLSLASDCPQVGYYGSFYYQVSSAGKLCAGRDRVMGRAGGSCKVRAIAPITPDR